VFDLEMVGEIKNSTARKRGGLEAEAVAKHLPEI
jgi:hypothetical protein